MSAKNTRFYLRSKKCIEFTDLKYIHSTQQILHKTHPILTVNILMGKPHDNDATVPRDKEL